MDTKPIEFETRAELSALVLRAIEASTQTIVLLDPTLRDWSLESPAIAQALRRALARGVLWRVLLLDTEWPERWAPRLGRLRRDFSARLEFRRLPSLLRLQDSFLVCDGKHTIRRLDAGLIKGLAHFEQPREANTPLDRFEHAWPISEPCLPATTLGL
jgi:hypothetical protein